MNKEQNNSETRKLPGFYIAVCCCVLAIGAAGYFTQREEAKRTSVAVTDAEETSAPTISAVPTKIPASEKKETVPPKPEQITPMPEVKTASASLEDYTEDNPDLQASVTVEAEETVTFSKPANGEILAGYSERPIYNEALDDWRTHNGVDIAVNEGGSVCAAADGTISEVGTNTMGCYVVINHNDGYMTKYMCLESAGEAKEGAEVKKGDVIGVIGKSKAEGVKESHIHFEIYKDGTCLDPAQTMQ